MREVKSLLLVGVGGQGTILAGKILSNGLLAGGYEVKMSEVHGMAQRGGSVSTQVRYGDLVFSPIIGAGEADILVAFEAMEALRWLPYLKPEGRCVVNDQKLPPVPVLLGKREYPADIIDRVRSRAPATVIDAVGIASAAGNPLTMNLVLLGALVEAMGLHDIDWDAAIADNVKPRFVEVNRAAFKAGAAAIGR